MADNRAIRDFLRAHPDAALEYVRTKEDALRRGHADLVSYSDHTHDRVAAIRDAARGMGAGDNRTVTGDLAAGWDQLRRASSRAVSEPTSPPRGRAARV
jgi:hypothetical protein